MGIRSGASDCGFGDRAIPGQEPSAAGRSGAEEHSAEEHKNVQRAVVLLRLAVALKQDRASDVLGLR